MMIDQAVQGEEGVEDVEEHSHHHHQGDVDDDDAAEWEAMMTATGGGSGGGGIPSIGKLVRRVSQRRRHGLINYLRSIHLDSQVR